MARPTKEWIGNGSGEIPPRVKVRVFKRWGGICHCCGRQIRAGEAWQCDHVVALCNDGEDRESNLRPILIEHHKNKTKADVAEKAKTYRKQKANLGIKKSGRGFRAWRRFDGTIVNRKDRGR